MGSGAMIYKQRFINVGSDTQILKGEDKYTDTQTHRQQGDIISLLLFNFLTLKKKQVKETTKLSFVIVGVGRTARSVYFARGFVPRRSCGRGLTFGTED
jgi:hypothetical protein